VAVPDGISDFTEVNIFFHPRPATATPTTRRSPGCGLNSSTTWSRPGERPGLPSRRVTKTCRSKW
jgi:hypothetical protein